MAVEIFDKQQAQWDNQEDVMSLSLTILNDWVNELLISHIEHAPPSSNPHFNSLSLSAKLEFLLPDVNNGEPGSLDYKLSKYPRTRGEEISAFTLKVTTGNVFIIRAILERRAFSKVPLSIGMRVKVAPEALGDPFLFFMVVQMAPAQSGDSSGTSRSKADEVEFGRLSSIEPYETTLSSNYLTDFNKEPISITIPMGLMFLHWGEEVFSTLGDDFTSHMIQWRVVADLRELRTRFLDVFKKFDYISI